MSGSRWLGNERRRNKITKTKMIATKTLAGEEEDTTLQLQEKNGQQKEEKLQQQQQQQQQQNFDFVADTLDGRMLCSSQCAYDVSNKCYFRGVGFKAGTVAKRISKGVNSALIGQTVDGIVISFRGTLPNSPLDWLQNAALFLSPVDDFDDSVKLHTGFYRATKLLWKPLTSTLKDMIQIYYQTHPLNLPQNQENSDSVDYNATSANEPDSKNDSNNDNWDHIPPPKIYLTGHSKGGAMASIAAFLMRQSSSLPNPTYVCTFASAKPGNSQFRDLYNQGVNQTSYEAYLDIIPFLPPDKNMMAKLNDNMTDMVDSLLWSETTVGKKDKYKWDYESVGTRKYIDENAEIMDVNNELDSIRIRDIEEKTILSFKRFLSAHCSSCPGEDDNIDENTGKSSKTECDGLYFAGVATDICDICAL
jgi:hypothetical protein